MSSQVSLGYHVGALRASLDVARGFNDGSGWSAITSAGVDRRIGRWIANANVRATFADADQMRYGFGIDDAQAARRQTLIAAGDPRLHPEDARAYSPDAGLASIGVGGSLTYVLTRHWMALGMLSASRIQGDAARSPLVRQAGQMTGALGLMFRR